MSASGKAVARAGGARVARDLAFPLLPRCGAGRVMSDDGGCWRWWSLREPRTLRSNSSTVLQQIVLPRQLADTMTTASGRRDRWPAPVQG